MVKTTISSHGAVRNPSSVTRVILPEISGGAYTLLSDQNSSDFP